MKRIHRIVLAQSEPINPLSVSCAYRPCSLSFAEGGTNFMESIDSTVAGKALFKIESDPMNGWHLR